MVQKKEDKKDVSLPAVIVLDNFDERFYPFTQELGSWCLQRICNSPIIDYTLSWVLRTEVKKVILLVDKKNEKFVVDVEKVWAPFFESLFVVTCENALSMGDCMRELERRHIISGDFLLVTNPGILSSSTLEKEVANYKKRRQSDRNNVMTMIYSYSVGVNKSVVGLDSETQRLRLYHREEESSTLEIDKVNFLEDITIRRDIVNTGIAICSLNILAQFSDNFDFRELDDVVKELLVNEEILLLNIHVDVLCGNESAFMIRDYTDLLLACNLIQENWFYPLTSVQLISNFASPAISQTNGRVRRRSQKTNNVQIGHNSIVDSSSKLSNVVIGDNTVIGPNCTIQNAIIGDNCKISGNNRIVEAILGHNVNVSENVNFPAKAIICSNVSIHANGIVAVSAALCACQPEEDFEDAVRTVEKNKNYLWYLRDGTSFWGSNSRRRTLSVLSESNHTEKEDEDSDGESSSQDAMELDGVSQFLSEVIDSLERMQQLANCENHIGDLIVEINSSKLAYNVCMEDVAKNIFYAFLGLPKNDTVVAIKALATKWIALFRNYYKPIKNQIQILMAIEERFKENDSFKSKVAKLVHVLYNDLDILEEESILEWANSLPQDSELRSVMKPIVDWLQEDSDDSDDSDEE